MKCPNCSAECADQATECDFCGHPITGGPAQVMPPTPPVSSVPPLVDMASKPLPPPNPHASSPEITPRSKVTIPNYLVWAIIVTVVATLTSMFSCCCLPLGLPSGIAAIVYALRVNKFLETGEVSSAEQASRNAKLWTWVTTVLAIIFTLWVIAAFTLQISDPAFMEEIRKQMEASR